MIQPKYRFYWFPNEHHIRWVRFIAWLGYTRNVLLDMEHICDIIPGWEEALKRETGMGGM